MNINPLVRKTSGDQVFDEIRRRIWTGELGPGDRLTQEDLAETMGVSRIPVREALIALAHTGAVVMEAHRGAFVVPLDDWAVRDHYELYAHIDGFALHKLIERAPAERREALAADCERTGSMNTDADLFDHVTSVRGTIHELGGSPRFNAVARGLVGIVPGNFFAELPGAVEITCRYYPEVGHALARSDAAAAVAAYTTMLREHGELVIRRLADRH